MNEVINPIPCPECPLQRCDGLRPLEPRQLDYMQQFKTGEIRLDRGQTLIRQGSRSAHLYTLLQGVLIRFRSLEDGRRQIVNFMFPGDLVGLQGAFEDPASHSIEAILEARLCVFVSERFPELISEHPPLGQGIIWLAAREERALEEHIVSLGQRTAKERVAYLAVWLLDRALATGLARDDNALDLPITQTQIADMLGLSLVHTNRTIGQLARAGLIEWRSRGIRIPNLERACELAHFDRRPGRIRPFI